jgi:hypothetical protein
MKHVLWPELEELGEAKVRELLRLDAYRGSKRYYVEEWLRGRELAAAQEALNGRKQRAAVNRARFSMLAVFALIGTAAFGHLYLVD